MGETVFPAQRVRKPAIFALVAALHVGVWWLLAAVPLKYPAASSSLELIYLPIKRPPESDRTPASPPRSPSGKRHRASGASSAPPQPIEAAGQAGSSDSNNSIHPPIDWQEELARSANQWATPSPAPPPRVFGARVTAPPPASKPPVFGWSRSTTHRIEADPGSAAVHLGDHCVIAWTPLPFPDCKLGNTKPNGDLFKHMRDPRQTGDWKDPP